MHQTNEVGEVMNQHPDFHIIIIDDNPAIHQDFIKILAAKKSLPKLESLKEELFGTQSKTTETEISLPQFYVDTASQGQEGVERIKKAIEVDVDNNIQVYISLMETPDFVMAMLLCSCIKKLTFKVHLFENLPKLLATLKTMLVNSIEMYITRQINLFKDGQITFDQLKRLFTHDEVITKIPEINQTAELYYKLVRYAEHFDLSSTHVTKAKIQGVISNLKM